MRKKHYRAAIMAMASAMVIGSSMCAFADEKQDNVDGKVTAGGVVENDLDDETKDGKSGTSVVIDIEASRLTIGDGNMVSLNVPAVLPVLFASDGQNYTPTNWGITNHDPNTAIDLTHIALVGNTVDGNTWTLSEPDADLKTLPVNSTTMKFSMGKQGEELTKIVNAGNDVKMTIGAAESREAGNKQLFSFGVDRTAFTEAKAIEGAYTLNLDFSFFTD